MKNYKTSLVLEGGGLRGAYTTGALAWLIDNNVEFDNVYGISTGAVHLCNYLLKDKKNLFDFSTKYVIDPRAIGVRAFLRCGRIVDYDLLFEELLLNTAKFDFSSLKNVKENGYIGLYVLEDGKTEYISAREIVLKQLQAATTLPIIGKPSVVNGKHLFDGGITEMIPIRQAQEDGCQKHLIITTKPEGYVRKPSNPIVVKIMRLLYHKWPHMAADYRIRHQNYYKQIEEVEKLENEDKALYIFPSKTSNVSRLGGSQAELEELYKLGYEDMENQKEKILELFK